MKLVKNVFFLCLWLVLLPSPPAFAARAANCTVSSASGLSSPSAFTTERVALVIGNSNYTYQPLRNPVNDATDLAKKLRELGYEVISCQNLDRRNMHRALQQFRKRLRGRQLGLFFYAGHGAQYQSRSYLIPINANIEDAADLPIEAFEAGYVLTQMESAGNRVSVVILDACRNLPYRGVSRSNERGLARLDAIRGSLIAYATSPGKVAQDGRGRNSPYTTALLAEIDKPVTLTELFSNVAWAVASATQDRQEPWYSASPLPKITLAQASVPSPFKPDIPQQAPPAGSTPRALQVFRDTLSDGTRGPSMVVIPAGEFWMGSPSDEKGRDGDERRHRVKVSAFAMGRQEVTIREFRRFVIATGYRTDAEKNTGGKDGCYVAYKKSGNWEYGYRKGRSWSDPGFSQGDEHPVVCVSWNDAVAYTQWLSKETGKDYRLPTEAEWEYAARAGTTTARYWGNDPDQACDYANVYDKTSKKENDFSWTHHACDDGYANTAPAGTFQANAWKLHDMLGNVWEWTCSKYDKEYGGDEKVCISNNQANMPRSLRGGSWNNYPRGVRSAFRFRNTPDNRFTYLGFRLSRSL